jgi:hypothetical protein
MKSADELKAELVELDKKLAEYKGLMNRRADIAQLLALTERVFGPKTTGASAGAGAAPAPNHASTNGNRLVTHSDFLAKALSAGQKDINGLLQEVRSLGWQGSGEDATDKKRLYVALYREKEKFALSNGKWRLLQASA